MVNATALYLKRFTTDGICSDEQKKKLKRNGLIAYSHGFWHLTDAGKSEAVRLGYLEPHEPSGAA